MTAVFEDGSESALSSEVTATPVLIDITAPQNPYAVMNHGAFMTNSPEVVVTISEPFVRKVFFKTVMKCVRAVSRSRAAMVTKSICPTAIAVGFGRVLNMRCASEMRA